MSDQNASRLSSIKSYMLIALIFNILSILLFLGLSLLLVGIVPLVLSIVVLATRVLPMREAAEKGDVRRLKELTSVGWGIVALIFSGVITGIMLLLADGPINELTEATASPAATSTMQQTTAIPVQSGDWKFCQVCGTKMDRSAAFCPKCGSPQK